MYELLTCTLCEVLTKCNTENTPPGTPTAETDSMHIYIYIYIYAHTNTVLYNHVSVNVLKLLHIHF